MDQPFTFSAYIHLILRRWPLIVAPALIALLVAAVVSFLTPVRYTASATLLAPKQQLVWRWDNKVYDVVDIRFDWRSEVMPLLTTTDVAQRALDQVGSQLQHPLDAQALIAATSTQRGSGSLFKVRVRAASAQDATLLANALAQALPETVADLYIGDDAAFQKALDNAQVHFNEENQKLIELRGSTGLGVGYSSDLAARGDKELFGAHNSILQELVLKNSYRAALKNAIDRIDLVLKAVDNDPQHISVTLLNLPELETYELSYQQLQSLAAADPPALINTLQKLRQQMSADLDRLAGNTIARQYDLAHKLSQWETILRNRGVWQETVTTLKRKLIELQMKRTIEGGRVQVVSPAITPSRPSQPNWPMNLGLAGAGGLLGGLMLAVIAAYLSDDD